MQQLTNDDLRKQLSQLQEKVKEQQEEIAKLYKSEERYKYFFENANDLIYSVDIEGKFLYVNRLWRDTLGYSQEEIKDLNIFDLIDSQYQGQAIPIFNPSKNGEKVVPTEAVFLTKNGEKIQVEGHCIPKYEGEHLEILGVFRDVTARKQLADEKEKLIADLKEALEHVKTLEGFLPICASCKKIRDDKGFWNQIECYIKDHSLVEFSHGICPDCIEKLYPDLKLDEYFGQDNN